MKIKCVGALTLMMDCTLYCLEVLSLISSITISYIKGGAAQQNCNTTTQDAVRSYL